MRFLSPCLALLPLASTLQPGPTLGPSKPSPLTSRASLRKRQPWNWSEFSHAVGATALGSLLAMSTIAPALALPPLNCDSFGCYPVELQPGYATRPELVKPPPAAEASSPRALNLARELKREKVTMFGAYWCGFCDRERQALGSEAWAMVDYVECDAKGFGANPQRCYDAGVEAYPTWVKAPAAGETPSSSQRRTGAQGVAGLEQFVGLPSPPQPPATPPAVTTASSPDALRVGAALKSKKAVLYGAYWCGFCNQDRQALGSEATSMIEYVECDSRGAGADPKRCADAGVDAFPTWEVNGQWSRGAKGLQGLAKLAGVTLTPE